MHTSSQWDWDTREKRTPLQDWKQVYPWVEEPYVSPDGEHIAAIVNLDEAVFNVCMDGNTWDSTFEKIWHLRFTPDGRLMALVCEDGLWTVAVDGQPWSNRFDYVWFPQFSRDGSSIAVAFQQEMQYGMAVDDAVWDTLYANIACMNLSPDGRHTAAAVQTKGLNEGDIFGFEQGAFTAAVNGEAWPQEFVNVWNSTFSRDGIRLAAEVRLNRYDYTIAVDGVPWNRKFGAVWEPVFHPGNGSVTAPVKLPDGWTLAKDGQPLWRSRFVQCWHHCYSPDAQKIAAIVAPTFGKWAIAVDGKPWRTTVHDFLTDMVFSPDGGRLAACAKDHHHWNLIVNDSRWSLDVDRLWPAVFSRDSRHVAAKVEKSGRFGVAIDGHLWNHHCERVWPPVFSPESDKVLLRSIENGDYYRRVLPVAELV